MNKRLLNSEGVIVFIISLYFYAQIGLSWWVFFFLLLIPDLSMLGYLVNNTAGSIIYNTVHSYILPGLIVMISMILDYNILFALGLVWVAHIGMDRSIGFGLKYSSTTKITHLQKV
ncbi:DUF4260 domain-containing protein [Anaerobacillus sp. 1_MG-2023]|uniref:DUF4260 domain-containing protein n=1 Tax=Anaerobacillus sp. 1_MG-2023 TaxID=3062655 RepID=UPI0026E2B246|nr:DUF4260 domain-containing protein [Anaerobacillus sp. 1_MG-2023]MDO6657347.1 DUF4260 domain-containing protein [Anaerobacillus sp. 1_MG-2023]